MTSILRGEGVAPKETIVLIGCVSGAVISGEGGQILADVIYM